MKEYAFGIDLGGTTAKVGLFTTSGALLEKWEVPTDTSNAGEHILENLADAIHAKMAEKEITSEQVEGVGIGVPGPVLDSRVVPIICANLGGWGERNVSAQLSGLLDGMKVLVGNDANVAALGEIWMGTAKGCRSAVMVTLGTGVGGGVIVQRFGDLVRGRRSTVKRIEEGLVTPTLAATPGDLSLVLPKRILDGIIEMIYALDKIAPGTANDDTLLYGVEVKFYNMEVALDEHLETPYKGLYVIGDGSGITHSLSHASASGVYVAREILENI